MPEEVKDARPGFKLYALTPFKRNEGRGEGFDLKVGDEIKPSHEVYGSAEILVNRGMAEWKKVGRQAEEKK